MTRQKDDRYQEQKLEKAVSERWEKLFREKYDVEQMDRTGGCAALLGDTYKGENLHPPGSDHWAVWGKNNRPELYTFQPYGMKMGCCKALITFCEKHGLEFELEKRGFYYPGVASLFVIRRSENR